MVCHARGHDTISSLWVVVGGLLGFGGWLIGFWWVAYWVLVGGVRVGVRLACNRGGPYPTCRWPASKPALWRGGALERPPDLQQRSRGRPLCDFLVRSSRVVVPRHRRPPTL